MVTNSWMLIFPLIGSLLHLITKIWWCYSHIMVQMHRFPWHYKLPLDRENIIGKKKDVDSCAQFQKASKKIVKLSSIVTISLRASKLHNLEGFFLLFNFFWDTRCFCFTTIKNQTISINFHWHFKLNILWGNTRVFIIFSFQMQGIGIEFINIRK